MDTDVASDTRRRLVLCLDGTGNSFQGNPSDTNIVKLLDMFDRAAPSQKHYYQPGIGTYTAEGAVNVGFFGQIQRTISQAIDAGLATSFDSHVIAAYRFLMRFYEVGDLIYIFGFSRGAFTARFLARMIAHVGLLSAGNEEMVPFAYKVYQDYEMVVGNPEEAKEYMLTFRSTFCRQGPGISVKSGDAKSGIKVHFLGLFDTVSSVGTFDLPFSGAMKLPNVIGTAEHVRHAVAIDERRVKFKVALLQQDQRDKNAAAEDIKEVWFPGNHGDVGGGWPPEKQRTKQKFSLWQRFKRLLFKTKSTAKAKLNKEEDWFQLSDIALKWMVDQLDQIHTDQILWNEKKDSFMRRYGENRDKAIKTRLHDTMALGGGSSMTMAFFWKLLEYLPIIRRWEYVNTQVQWSYVRFPLNRGGTRDIPPGSFYHNSVIERLKLFEGDDKYTPRNDVTNNKRLYDFEPVVVETDQKVPLTGHPYFVPHKDTDPELGVDRVYQLVPNGA